MAQESQRESGERPIFIIFMNNYPKKTIILAKSLILFLVAFSIFGTARASEISPANIIKLVNESREKNTVAPLVENKMLDKIAEDKLEDMIENNYFAHTSPSGVSPWSWYQKEGYDYKYAGENLAINFFSAEEQHNAWMNSVTHRKNILNSNFQEIGVAVAAGNINGQNALIAVQEFGTLLTGNIPIDPSKNFSGKEKNNIVKEGVKIAPQVLSAKDVSTSSSGNPSNPVGANWKDTALDWVYEISSLIVLLSLVLAPLPFLAMATEKLALINEENKKIAHVK